MRNWIGGLLLLACGGAVAASGVDGRWQLGISGHQSFVFGDARFGGGVWIPWEVMIRFEVRDGEYLLGSGSARWRGDERSVSWPDGWFSCAQVEGTYLDSNLELHQTPRVRFTGFPVAGRVHDGRILLRPGYSPPGNYLAVTYECLTENPAADNWFLFAERGKQVFGRRQDAETWRDGGHMVARVREVGTLPPESELDLPLEDGWTFSQGAGEDLRSLTLRLQRLP